jgi:hypothetical protein
MVFDQDRQHLPLALIQLHVAFQQINGCLRNGLSLE